MKKIIIIASLILMPSLASAVDSGRAQVTSISYSEGGNLFFNTAATRVNDGCSSSSYLFAANNPRLSKYYAMLLSAQNSEKKVLVRVQGCINLGSTSYPRVTLLQVTN